MTLWVYDASVSPSGRLALFQYRRTSASEDSHTNGNNNRHAYQSKRLPPPGRRCEG